MYERSLQKGERAGELLAASDSCVINIRVSEGGRGREGEMGEGGVELEGMGGAALLRNAKHRISSSTVRNHRDAD